MARYIDIDNYIEYIEKNICGKCIDDVCGACMLDSGKAIAEALPTADVVEVKYGKWIWDINAIDWGIGGWVCSECHAVNSNIPQKPTYRPLLWAGSKFCPNCGAKMDGGKAE